jgi:hypothetical protein
VDPGTNKRSIADIGSAYSTNRMNAYPRAAIQTTLRTAANNKTATGQT